MPFSWPQESPQMGGGQSGDRRSLREELATTPYTRRFCCSSFFHVTWLGRRWEEGGWAVTSLTCFPLHRGTAAPPRPWRCGGFNQEAASRGWRPAWRAPRGGGASFPPGGNRLRAKGRQVTRRDRDGRWGSISPLRHRCVRAERWQSSSVPRGSWC